MSTGFIPLSDPHVTAAEIEAVTAVLHSPRLSAGPSVKAFEDAFATYTGRKHAIAVSSGTAGLLLVLKAYGIGPGDEVIASAYSWHETAHAVALSGATPVFADIDYWAGTLAPEKAEARIGEKTRAIVAGNTNGHPAPWDAFRELAQQRGLVLIEDSTEAIGSVYQGKAVGSFGDCAVFDFSQPGAIICGEGGMIVTDNEDIAYAIRRHRGRTPDERASVSVTSAAPYQAKMSDLAAALGLTQLKRIEEILALRDRATGLYFNYLKSFEGIKDPYIAPGVDKVRWFLYTVHLGTRFSRSSRDAILEDLKTEEIESAAYSQPLHLQRYYLDRGHRRGELFVTEKVADRAIALPFHPHLTETQIAFIVGTMKDASINVGAGTAIYL
ncbi:MAG: DegT/DnrJ/EryC1/StrS family aminotransferase [Rhodomicrobium sp.]